MAVLVVGIALTAALALELVATIDTSNSRLLNGQVRQTAAAFRSMVSSLQDPLVAADGIAASVGTESFRLFVHSLVGPKAPFRSVSLWRLTHGAPRLVVSVGMSPDFPQDRGTFARFLRSVRPNSQLTIAGLMDQPVRGLGFAERQGGTGAGLVVYAEGALPGTSWVHQASSSPFNGLAFAIFLGRDRSPSELMETTIPVPVRVPSASEVVPFGTAFVTVVATLGGRDGSSLPTQLPWLAGIAGLILAGAAALSTERLVRRRWLAEVAAIDSGRKFDTQREIAETLQHSLLPEAHPSHLGLDIATRNVPGVAQLDVGGDWFDVITIDDGRVFVAIGDVSGRGLPAARLMATLRPAIRAYAVQGDDPALVLRKLDALVSVVRDGCFATVLCAILDVPHGRVTLASAGHPPALLIDHHGATYVNVPISTPVGVTSPLPAVSSELFVAPGSTLILYTDALVERQGQELAAGLEQLRSAAGDIPGTVEQVADQLIDSLLPAGSTDDLALLAVRWQEQIGAGPHATGVGGEWTWTETVGSSGAPTSRRFPCDPASVRQIRQFVDDALPPMAPEQRDVVTLVASELASNAVIHARTAVDVAIVLDASSGRIRVGVGDGGGGTPVRRGLRPQDPRGRGMQLVDGLSDHWGVEWSSDGTHKTVWFESHLFADTQR